MKKSTRYCECIQIMQSLAERGLTTQCLREALVMMITIRKGGDPRTIRSWIKSLRLLKMISFHDRNPNIVILHFDRVPEALPSLVMRGQKKLM